ncbi:hypothetical protein H0H87_005077 [Tephrocybe sp. NHM501043]|nr:hypothetical protein H0H87_005077 [Tephrocybe sp. NHM501043]
MADFTVVDPRGWEYDLHSVYSAYIGYFQLHNVPWYVLFNYSNHCTVLIPVKVRSLLGAPFLNVRGVSRILVAHDNCHRLMDRQATHRHPPYFHRGVSEDDQDSVSLMAPPPPCLLRNRTPFLPRYGETLPQAPNILQVTPFETANRHLRHISDYASYKKLYSTLPAVVLSAVKARIKAGEPKAVKELWERRDKTFLAIDFEWSERNEKSCLEWGYAAVRCGHLEAMQYEIFVLSVLYPPETSTQFGDSQIASKTKLPEIIQAIISSLASPDSETTSNSLVLVAHGISNDLARLEEMKIKLPHNLLTIDTSIFERVLHSSGARGIMLDPRTNAPRVPGSTLSLENLLRSFSTNPIPVSPKGDTPAVSVPLVLPNVMMHNAGNDAFLALFALQMLVDPSGTQVPVVKKGRIGRPGAGPGGGGSSPTSPSPVIFGQAIPITRPRSMMFGVNGNGNQAMEHSHAPAFQQRTMTMPLFPVLPAVGMGSYDLAEEFGNMKLNIEGQGEKDSFGTGMKGRRMPGRANGYAMAVGSGGRR